MSAPPALPVSTAAADHQPTVELAGQTQAPAIDDSLSAPQEMSSAAAVGRTPPELGNGKTKKTTVVKSATPSSGLAVVGGLALAGVAGLGAIGWAVLRIRSNKRHTSASKTAASASSIDQEAGRRKLQRHGSVKSQVTRSAPSVNSSEVPTRKPSAARKHKVGVKAGQPVRRPEANTTSEAATATADTPAPAAAALTASPATPSPSLSAVSTAMPGAASTASSKPLARGFLGVSSSTKARKPATNAAAAAAASTGTSTAATSPSAAAPYVSAAAVAAPAAPAAQLAVAAIDTPAAAAPPASIPSTRETSAKSAVATAAAPVNTMQVQSAAAEMPVSLACPPASTATKPIPAAVSLTVPAPVEAASAPAVPATSTPSEHVTVVASPAALSSSPASAEQQPPASEQHSLSKDSADPRTTQLGGTVVAAIPAATAADAAVTPAVLQQADPDMAAADSSTGMIDVAAQESATPDATGSTVPSLQAASRQVGPPAAAPAEPDTAAMPDHTPTAAAPTGDDHQNPAETATAVKAGAELPDTAAVPDHTSTAAAPTADDHQNPAETATAVLAGAELPNTAAVPDHTSTAAAPTADDDQNPAETATAVKAGAELPETPDSKSAGSSNQCADSLGKPPADSSRTYSNISTSQPADSTQCSKAAATQGPDSPSSTEEVASKAADKAQEVQAALAAIAPDTDTEPSSGPDSSSLGADNGVPAATQEQPYQSAAEVDATSTDASSIAEMAASFAAEDTLDASDASAISKQAAEAAIVGDADSSIAPPVLPSLSAAAINDSANGMHSPRAAAVAATESKDAVAAAATESKDAVAVAATESKDAVSAAAIESKDAVAGVEQLSSEESTALATNAEDDEAEGLTAAEVAAEALLQQATTAWNVNGNRNAGLKFNKQALAALKAGEHRPRLLADVASNLADMHYALAQWDEAYVAVKEAMDAATAADDAPLLIKLSNNMGAILRRLDRPEEAMQVHRNAYDMAVSSLGGGHPFATLARTNLVETLEEMGKRDDARALLLESLLQLTEEVRSLKDDLAQQREVGAEGMAPPPSPNESAEGSDGAAEEPRGAALLRRTHTAIIRAHSELGRLELKAHNFAAARSAFEASVSLCDIVYGVDSAESAGPMFNLASCLRTAGAIPEAIAMFERVHAATLAAKGEKDQNLVAVARVLTEMHDEAGNFHRAEHFASAGLTYMQALLGTKVSPYLTPYYQLAIRAKDKAGDVAGAENLKRLYLSGLAQATGAAHRAGSRGDLAASSSLRGGVAGRGPSRKAGGKK